MFKSIRKHTSSAHTVFEIHDSKFTQLIRINFPDTTEAAIIVVYHIRRLNVPKNTALYLIESNFNLNHFDALFKSLDTYFNFAENKHLNINYPDYHDDIVKEFIKLSSLK